MDDQSGRASLTGRGAIGERLFLSRRTIASHLYRIFPKLGVASRGQLARVVPEEWVSD